jgi:hypothetical protein
MKAEKKRRKNIRRGMGRRGKKSCEGKTQERNK